MKAFLEKPTLIPVGKSVMEGLWHPGALSPPLLLCPPRGGGAMDHPVVAEVAWSVATSGRPTLRFNHRGAGASQGAEGNEKSRAADAQAALELLLANTGKRAVAIAAFAEGARPALALAAREAAVGGLCLIGPLEIEPEEVAALKVPVKVLLADQSRTGREVWKGRPLEGRVELIPLADDSFSQNLLQVGKSVRQFLEQL